MNVLILSTMYPNSVLYLSGVFVHKQVLSLKRLGTNVVVIAPVPYVFPFLSLLSLKWNSYKKIPLKEIIDGILIYHPRYVALPRGLLKNLWAYIYFFNVKRVVKKEKISFDIIHAHGSIPNDYAAFLLSRTTNRPYVITVHGDTIYLVAKNKKWLRLTKKTLSKADVIIAVSTNLKEKIKGLVEPKNDIQVVLNGYEPSDSLENTKQSMNSEKIKILFAATLIERKGCEVLLRAFRQLYDKYINTILIIVGGGELLSKMKKLALDLGISKRTEFKGTLNHTEVLKIMKNSDIFILPSWDEAFGVVYLEALSFKKPVIGTEGEGIKDVIVDNENGFLVKPRDSNSIVEKLTPLIESENLRAEIGEKGFNSIKYLTWENSAKKVFGIYKSLMTEK